MNNKYLTKIAALSSDTKKEIAQTGVLAAVGGATGYLGNKVMEGPMKHMRMSNGAKAALAVGGLGLLGDIAAVKANRQIEKRALRANVGPTYKHETLEYLGDIDISHAKDVTPKKLPNKIKALIGLGALGVGSGAAYHIYNKRAKKRK